MDWNRIAIALVRFACEEALGLEVPAEVGVVSRGTLDS
jgi:hypothetical protein